MSEIKLEFDYTIFKKEIPKFKDLPEEYVQNFWTIATYYMSDNATYGYLTGPKRRYGLNLLTAHLIYDQNIIDENGAVTVDKSAQIDEIQVDSALPPTPDNYTWQLNTSPYGQLLLLLLKSNNAGGWYVSVPNRNASVNRCC